MSCPSAPTGRGSGRRRQGARRRLTPLPCVRPPAGPEQVASRIDAMDGASPHKLETQSVPYRRPDAMRSTLWSSKRSCTSMWDRVRSLLSQMAGGFIEEVRTSSSSDMSGQAQAVVFGVGAKGDYKQGTMREEARSLQDLTFVAFEGLANENGYITEFPGELMDVEAWESGEVHAAFSPGQLVSVECPIQLLDSSFFRSRIDRFTAMAEAFVDMNLPATPPKSASKSGPKSANAKSQQQVRAQAMEALLGGSVGLSQIDAISRLIESFAGDSVLLRVLPCGLDNLEFGFTGALLGRREYIQEERENLFGRYGQAPTVWRTVFQIAGIPDKEATSASYEPGSAVNDQGTFSRAQVEKMAGGLLGMMEQIGVVEGPQWPSISVTPLGIYRTMPKAPL
jgi:hypothetical protein